LAITRSLTAPAPRLDEWAVNSGLPTNLQWWRNRWS